MRRLVTLALALVALTVTGNAVAARWTPAQAAARLKTTYTTVDTVRLHLAQERLDRDLAAGLPETDARVIRDRLYITQAQTGARPDHVTCVGVGKKSSRYLKFHCSAHVIGVGEYASGWR
jgi:hypothetical protein